MFGVSVNVAEEEVRLGIGGDAGICIQVGGGITEVRSCFFRRSVGRIIVVSELTEVDGAGGEERGCQEQDSSHD